MSQFNQSDNVRYSYSVQGTAYILYGTVICVQLHFDLSCTHSIHCTWLHTFNDIRSSELYNELDPGLWR